MPDIPVKPNIIHYTFFSRTTQNIRDPVQPDTLGKRSLIKILLSFIGACQELDYNAWNMRDALARSGVYLDRKVGLYIIYPSFYGEWQCGSTFLHLLDLVRVLNISKRARIRPIPKLNCMSKKM